MLTYKAMYKFLPDGVHGMMGSNNGPAPPLVVARKEAIEAVHGGIPFPLSLTSRRIRFPLQRELGVEENEAQRVVQVHLCGSRFACAREHQDFVG